MAKRRLPTLAIFKDEQTSRKKNSCGSRVQGLGLGLGQGVTVPGFRFDFWVFIIMDKGHLTAPSVTPYIPRNQH